MDARELILRELGTLYKHEVHHNQPFKARAYQKVIQQIQARAEPIHSMDDLADIKGVGSSIKDKIHEILATGALAAARDIRDDGRERFLETLTSMYGIGPVKAKAILKAGVCSLEDLDRRKDELLNEKQKIGLKYARDIVERIPRDEMEKHERFLLDALQQADPRFEGQIVGSFRRKAASSGDVDLIVKMPRAVPAEEQRSAFAKYIDLLVQKGYVTDRLADGPKKCMAFVRLPEGVLHRRLDVLLTPEEEYPFALLYFTGPDKFNIACRNKAIKKGMRLNEHELIGAQIVVRTEKDIFDILDIEYAEPEDRI